MGSNAKKDLYAFVDCVRRNLGIKQNVPINTLDLCKRLSDVNIVYHDFETTGFCGAAFAGDTVNTIVLNSARFENEQNFDCGHELVHLLRHRDKNNGIFSCLEGVQNSFIEWEANEGSAQLHVPYQDFIPRFVSLLSTQLPVDVQGIFAEHYHVTRQVISFRLDSLSYEIDQYIKGVPINQVELLSRRQRLRRGIKTTCYQAVCDFALDWDSAI